MLMQTTHQLVNERREFKDWNKNKKISKTEKMEWNKGKANVKNKTFLQSHVSFSSSFREIEITDICYNKSSTSESTGMRCSKKHNRGILKLFFVQHRIPA